MDIKIKETKQPLLLIYSILKNESISDNDKIIATKHFIQYHILIAIKYNLLLVDGLENNKKTYSFIEDVYLVLSKQLQILPFIIKLKKAYNDKNYKCFWDLEIDSLILYFKNLHNKFLYLFDGSKGYLYLHLKLKGMKEGNHYHYEQLLDRLKKTFDLFKKPFFNEYKIMLLSYYQFIELKFENMIKYTEYIFNKINNILLNSINYLVLYDNYRIQLYNLLYNTSDINININNVDSDIDTDDITLIVKN
jgi:hypothetical protein